MNDCRNCLYCKKVASHALLKCSQFLWVNGTDNNYKTVRLTNQEERSLQINDRKLFEQAIRCPSFENMDE